MKFVHVCVCVMCMCDVYVHVCGVRGVSVYVCGVCGLCVCGVCMCVWYVRAVESGQGERWGIASRAWWWHRVAAIAPRLPLLHGLM